MKPASSIKFLLPAFLLIGAGLTITSYAGPFFVPDVTGETETNAIAILDGDDCCEYGGSSRDNSEIVPIDSVISQDPAAGTEVTPVQSVTLVVSDGPTTTTTTTTTTAATTTAATTTAATTTAATTTAATTTAATTTAATTTAATTTAATTTAATTTAATTTAATTTAATTTAATTTAATTTAATTTAGTTTTTLPGGGTLIIGGCDTGISDPDGRYSRKFSRCEGKPDQNGCNNRNLSKLKKKGVITKREMKEIRTDICQAQFNMGNN